jgi:hypothetical protein
MRTLMSLILTEAGKDGVSKEAEAVLFSDIMI